jgi:DNA-binding MarR family transcriptional regulator/GNAT superfamily N-acetyltransferase
MINQQVSTVRAFARRVSRSIGALQDNYLARGRPLGEARLIFEIGPDGAEIGALRDRLGLDSGYLSRLLRSLEAQGLVHVRPVREDARRRRAQLTATGLAERIAYDGGSDDLARSLLSPLGEQQRKQLVGAMAEVTRLLRAASVAIAEEPPDSPDGVFARNAYFAELAARFEEGFDPGAHDPNGDLEMSPPGGCFLIGRLDGDVVGCGGLKPFDARAGEIKRVWTAPSARGLGIARRIMEVLEQRALAAGMTLVCLDTNRALKEAQNMYRQLGYREVARYNDNPYADHWFEKEIRPAPQTGHAESRANTSSETSKFE